MDGCQVIHGDCLEYFGSIGQVDSIVTDPPYGLSFMGKAWDRGAPGVEFWSGALSCAKPEAEPNDDKKEMARVVIQKCADDAGIDFNRIIYAANDYLDNSEYLCEGGRWDGHWLDESFWDAFEVFTGRYVPIDDRGSFFSCSC